MIKTICDIIRLPIGWRLEQDRGLGFENCGVFPTYEAAFNEQQRRVGKSVPVEGL